MNRWAEKLPRAWPAFDLRGYRDHPHLATYSGFSYEDLPPLEEPLDDSYRWLEDEAPKAEWSLRVEGAGLELDLRGIEESSGMSLPAAFLTFLRSPELQARIRSCTACYLQLPDRIRSTAGAEEGNVIHFLSDQQWCLHWYLHINRHGEECVLCSPDPYGFDDEEFGRDAEAASRARPLDLAEEDVAFCAPSFIEFMYRFWLENEIWFALNDGVPLTARQQAYVEHYRRLGRDGERPTR